MNTDVTHRTGIAFGSFYSTLAFYEGIRHKDINMAVFCLAAAFHFYIAIYYYERAN